MKRILMFQDYFYKGGIEKVILDIRNNISNDYNVDILTMVNKSDEKIISLLNKDYQKLFKRAFFGLKKLHIFIKNNYTKYDIMHIHCYNSFGLIYAFIASRYFNKIIVHAHNCNIDRDFLYIKHMLNSIIKRIFKRKKYIYIAVSDDCNNFCFSSKRAIIIPNGIDYHKYYYNSKKREKYREKFNIKNNEIVIGNIGRFNEQKNHQFIIKVFNEINKHSNNYKLILIGEGILKNNILNDIKKKKLSSKVIVLDNRNDIPDLINMYDIFLFPSIYEGFGIAVVENEVNGKYVFVSDNVPKSVNISSRFVSLSLKKSELEWANEIMNIKDKELILNKKLDIKYFIDYLEKIYSDV